MTESVATGARLNRGAFLVRPATPDDATEVAALYARAAAKSHDSESAIAHAPRSPGAFELMIQTGGAFTIAERDGHIAGAVRWWDDDGIAWFDLLAAAVTGAGRRLLRAMETGAQDRGLRLIRLGVPGEGALADAFQRWGYLPIGRATEQIGGRAISMLTLEKRLPLLTVREQRRGDAIGQLTGEDPWVFEQGARPGWFVASDGDRVVGVISVRDAGTGTATISLPVLAEEYRGRGIEVWMVERCATYAETNGFHTAELPLTPETDSHRRAFEDRTWQREPPKWIRRFTSNAPREQAEWA